MPLLKNDITDYLRNNEIDLHYIDHLNDGTTRFECPNCKTITKIKWQNFKRKNNYSCNKCLVIERIKQEFNYLNLGILEKIYPLKGEDNKNRWHLDFICSKNKHVNKAIRHENLSNRKTCPQCNYDVIIWNKEEIQNLVNKNNFLLINTLETPTNANTKIIIKDKNNYLYETSPHLLNQNIKQNRSLDPFQQNSFKYLNIKNWIIINRPEYELLNDNFELLQVNSKSKIKLKYIGDQLPKNEYPIFECNLAKFKNGQEHPYFKRRSKGERTIRDILFKLEFNFKHQYSIQSNGQTFYFDFAILNDEEQVVCFIEYHGNQHFEQVEYFGGDNALKKQKKHDKLKKEYANSINIKLLIINQSTLGEFENIIKKY